MLDMQICLNMIVKNEAHVIERCLRSVKPFIHAWAISDTGSTDGTQDLIRNALIDLPGELIERAWVDFAHNRNEALDLAQKYGDYVLLMDADDVLEHEAGFAFDNLDAPAYSVEFRLDSNYYFRPVLVRLGLGWIWRGVLHEGLYSSPPLETRKLLGVWVRERREGARSRLPAAEKYAADAAVLQRALKHEPGNMRYAFYLAQSLRDAGRLSEACEAYQHRIGMGGWDEEVYYAKLQMASLLEIQGKPEGEVIAAYLQAYQSRPSRAEPLCALARYYRERNRFSVALLFAREAAKLPLPSDILFLDVSVYHWRSRDELAIAAYWCGELELCASLCRELLSDPNLPAEQYNRVRQNLCFAEKNNVGLEITPRLGDVAKNAPGNESFAISNNLDAAD